MGALTHNGEVLQGLPANASQINFDKTGTNLNSTQTENAIKEVNTKVNTNTDDITQLKSGLTNAENSIVTPSCGYIKLGSGAIDGSNPVVVSLGNNNILDYDALFLCVAYYESGIATYGSLMIPSLIAKDLYSADAGISFFAKNDAFNDIVSIGVLLHMGNNNITFAPSATPAGGYYSVFGFKWRTSN